MGISGSYLVRDGEVTVDLKFPMLVPGSMRQKVQDDIERKLDGLFAVAMRGAQSSGTTIAPARSFIRSTAA